MNIDRVRSFYYQRPIHPFTIHTASGESYTVKHPETMAIDEEDGVIVLLPGRGKFAMVDVSSITEITRDFTIQASASEA
jgi:hypothetical protein